MFVYDILSQHAVDRKDKIAFEDVNTNINYGDLHHNAMVIASKIVSHVEERNKPIVVFIERNVESIQTFFGVLYSGHFYVPIDISQPESRINLILDTLNPALLINASGKEIKYDFPKYQMISYSELFENSTINPALVDKIEGIIDTDPMYAKFTSGSTGVPKGVLVSYKSVNDLIIQFEDVFKFSEENIFGNQAPFDFDVSVKDIYNSIRVGAKVVIIPKVNFSFPAKLIDFLNEYKINTAIWATSVLRIVENLNGFANQKPNYLKQVMFSGEIMPNKVLNYWREYLPNVEFVNLYGPTEITCNCSYYKVNREFDNDEPLPIGIPFKNTRIILLNEENELIEEANVTGELCVMGSSLALGYYNNPKVSEEAFTVNPNNPFYEEKIYRTGDLAFWNENKELMFVSRIDHQIKHMGHRIELGEIEAHINALDYIDAAACIYDKENEKLVLFYQSHEDKKKQIYLDMMKKVPKYMIPNKMYYYEKLPLNKNAKIDRKLLEKKYYDEQN